MIHFLWTSSLQMSIFVDHSCPECTANFWPEVDQFPFLKHSGIVSFDPGSKSGLYQTRSKSCSLYTSDQRLNRGNNRIYCRTGELWQESRPHEVPQFGSGEQYFSNCSGSDQKMVSVLRSETIRPFQESRPNVCRPPLCCHTLPWKRTYALRAGTDIRTMCVLILGHCHWMIRNGNDDWRIGTLFPWMWCIVWVLKVPPQLVLQLL